MWLVKHIDFRPVFRVHLNVTYATWKCLAGSKTYPQLMQHLQNGDLDACKIYSLSKTRYDKLTSNADRKLLKS